MRRTEIAVGINAEQDAALKKNPENVALPIDRLLQSADDFKMCIAVALHVPVPAGKTHAAERCDLVREESLELIAVASPILANAAAQISAQQVVIDAV